MRQMWSWVPTPVMALEVMPVLPLSTIAGNFTSPAVLSKRVVRTESGRQVTRFRAAAQFLKLSTKLSVGSRTPHVAQGTTTSSD